MAPIVSSVDIARPPGEVFPYATDPARFAEWQEGVVSGHAEGDGPPGVGTRYVTIRKIRGTDQPVTSEITEISAPRSWAMRGIDGPVRVNVNLAVDPLNGDTQSRVTISVEFVGHGAGKLLVPFLIQQARKEAPRNAASLKERLESEPSTGG
jgi:uncharacterized protein YndB with AHSA1/START domain